MLLYPAAIDLSTATLRQLADLLRGHRRRIGSHWRRLSPSDQALVALAHLRCGDTYTRLAAGFGIGLATVCRYLHEAVDLLAAHAPTLTAAVWQLCWSHSNYAILDGTLIRTHRLAATPANFSGKHRDHGVNLQALTDPYGQLVWLSDALPGNSNDLTATRTHGILHTCAQAELLLLADGGYRGPESSDRTTLLVPYRNYQNSLTPPYKRANTTHAQARARGERGFATLKAWRVFTRVRCSPHRITNLAKAVLVLEHGPHQ